MESPCKNCMERKFYAKTFDMHFSGEDCPYECEEYEHWKKFQAEEEKQKTFLGMKYEFRD